MRRLRDMVYLIAESLEQYRRTRETLGAAFDNVDLKERDKCMKTVLEVSGALHAAMLSDKHESAVGLFFKCSRFSWQSQIPFECRRSFPNVCFCISEGFHVTEGLIYRN